MTSGVPQGLELRPKLIKIYRNDVESELLSKVAKFVDDTELGGKTLLLVEEKI